MLKQINLIEKSKMALELNLKSADFLELVEYDESLPVFFLTAPHFRGPEHHKRCAVTKKNTHDNDVAMT